jgi:hypothetical protein
MIRTIVLGSVAFAMLAGMAAAPARADRDWRWHHGPHGWFHERGPAVIIGGPPVYYAPPPVVYAAPPAVYVAPPVVFVPPIAVGIGVRIR